MSRARLPARVRTGPVPGHCMHVEGRDRSAVAAFVAMALALLAMTLAWHVPMMLWDHLDLVPLYRASLDGSLGPMFWSIHGGHMHSAAYAVLLVTTGLSGGQPWLDCVASWLLLAGYGWIVMRVALRGLDGRAAGTRWLLCMVLLVLYPGHLANLQWGWQVAVFLCLLGVAIAVACMAAARLDLWRSTAGAAAAALAYLSFATGIALIPVALIMLGLRRELSWPRKAVLALPWLLLGALVLYSEAAQVRAASDQSLPQLVRYGLNYLGSGISRFAEDLAPWLGLLALASGTWAFITARRERTSLYWLCFALFAVVSAVLTALGRASAFGVDHAFVTRYVSFSSLFWVGWLGLMITAVRPGVRGWRSWPRWLMGLAMVFAVANALHMIKQAAEVGEESRATAARIRATYPAVDEAVLRSIYFDRPGVARERLRQLHRWSFAPFEAEQGAAD